MENERKEKERQEKEKQENERLAKEKQEADRIEKERIKQEQKETQDKKEQLAAEHLQNQSLPNQIQPEEKKRDTTASEQPDQFTSVKTVQSKDPLIERNNQNKENEKPVKNPDESSKDKNISSPIVIRRKQPDEQPSEDSRKEKCISTIEIPAHIPADHEIEKPTDKSTTSTTPQGLPNTDTRRKTVIGSEYATPDQLMQKVSLDEQRRKASYNMLKSYAGAPGMDTLHHSGSGITRVINHKTVLFLHNYYH